MPNTSSVNYSQTQASSQNTMSSHDQDFGVLARFLSCFQDEVQGHEALPLSPKDEEDLGRLARGDVASKMERERLVALLLQSSAAMACFATNLKLN